MYLFNEKGEIIGEEFGNQRCLDACFLISWGDDSYLYTINMTKIEITNINRNTKNILPAVPHSYACRQIRKQVLVSIT